MKENLWEIYMIGEVFVCWCSELLSKKKSGNYLPDFLGALFVTAAFVGITLFPTFSLQGIQPDAGKVFFSFGCVFVS